MGCGGGFYIVLDLRCTGFEMWRGSCMGCGGGFGSNRAGSGFGFFFYFFDSCILKGTGYMVSIGAVSSNRCR